MPTEIKNYGIYVPPAGTSTFTWTLDFDADGWMIGRVDKNGWRHDLKCFPSGLGDRWVHVEPEPRIGYATHAE